MTYFAKKIFAKYVIFFYNITTGMNGRIKYVLFGFVLKNADILIKSVKE